MAAYIIVDTRIEDPEAFEVYKANARPIAEKFGGVYLARGGEMKILEDDLWRPTRVAIIEFPDRERAEAFATSQEYAPFRAIRQSAARCTFIIVEGL